MYSIISPKIQQKRQIRSQSNTIQKNQQNGSQNNQSININLDKNGYIDQSREKFNKEGERLDEEFNSAIQIIENQLVKFNKHEKIRIDQWIKKLCQVTSNLVWKQNRNLYVKVLQDMVSNTTMYEPFTKVPPEGPLPRLTKFDIPYHARSIIRDFEKENENFNFDKLSFQNHSPSKFGQANLKNMREQSNERLRGYSSNSKSFLSINNNNNNNNVSINQHNNSNISYANSNNILGNLGQNQLSNANLSQQYQIQALNKNSIAKNNNQSYSLINNSYTNSSQSLTSGNRYNNILSNEISNAIQKQQSLESNSNVLQQNNTKTGNGGICETCKIYSNQKEEIKSPQLQEKHQNLLNTVNSIFAEKRSNSGNRNNSSVLSPNLNLLSDNQNLTNQSSGLKRQLSIENHQQSNYKRSGSCYGGSTVVQRNESSGNSTYQLPLSNLQLLKNKSNNKLTDEQTDVPSRENNQNELLHAKNNSQNQKSNISQFQYSYNNNSHSTINDSKNLEQPSANYNTERQSNNSFSGNFKQNQINSVYNSIENISKNTTLENPQSINTVLASNSNLLVKDYLNQVDQLHLQVQKEKEANSEIQMQLDLLRLNENDLKKENNLKQTHINSLTKANEKLKQENLQYKEKHLNFIAVLQKVSKYLQSHEDTLSDDLEYQYLIKELENIQQKTSDPILQTSPSSLGENRNHLKKKKRTDLDQNYQQYAENIKQKLQQTNDGTNEFLSYLNRIKKNLD
ncbi:hypothetical protein TTHERM_00459250 (macronuclear) [Tetrahymena thermophila SB210]|uniref:DUF4485 domain-containing protein n=1 Tax=Tetrahymena thermophila (strain SB210) TaxID=312017 RepID=I7MI89_TETTS|nr:hypothetical protein TTHERM_00459250 [Tetrahymena thermophila SB210]EAS03988.1 hypothetical protein TTHERM_00459250 [Tetrahymena thermophila SB210]|eukprot:XP_001024233.1 hypothetical protein TTHERM_00459250 [Tetrahymena thermophila SB210]